MGKVNTKSLIQRIATKYNLPLHKVEEAVYYQFKYTTKVMREGKFEPVRLPYLGKFHVMPGRLKHINNAGSDNSK